MEDDPSDPRAEVIDGNVTTCEQVGFPDSEQLTGGTGDASDDFIVGTVTEYDVAGAADDATALQVEITQEGLEVGVVVDAVVVKGGADSNLYTAPHVPSVTARTCRSARTAWSLKTRKVSPREPS